MGAIHAKSVLDKGREGQVLVGLAGLLEHNLLLVGRHFEGYLALGVQLHRFYIGGDPHVSQALLAHHPVQVPLVLGVQKLFCWHASPVRVLQYP